MAPHQPDGTGVADSDFVGAHRNQLELLQIPGQLVASLTSQLEQFFGAATSNNNAQEKVLHLLRAALEQAASLKQPGEHNEAGRILVLPHLCSWDMVDEANDGMYKAIQQLPTRVLESIVIALRDGAAGQPGSQTAATKTLEEKEDLIGKILTLAWSRVILYRDASGRVRGALPPPPYFPQVPIRAADDDTEADLTGPFGFRYHQGDTSSIDCSLAYLSPGSFKGDVPTLDLVPMYSVPNRLTRSVRYAALLTGYQQVPSFALQEVKTHHADFVQRMHIVRQKVLAEPKPLHESSATAASSGGGDTDSTKVWKVYTDNVDPLDLAHPEAGLTDPHFEMTSTIEDADIVYSYKSLYVPGTLDAFSDGTLLNQFPYEGALVQKDHLAREIQENFGLPQPSWALETYDLDVQLGEFVGASILAKEREGILPLWIIKPARGTQSKGHVVTRSLAQVLKMIDAGVGSRVAQRYIEHPVCYDGRKVDCRCIVLMTDASPPGKPTLYMHNRVYFRIAGKAHSIDRPADTVDYERIMTAMHLVMPREKQEQEESSWSKEDARLPVDYKTIAKLEQDYEGFQWKDSILPKIHNMIRDIFGGITKAYPAMARSRNSRAVYGIDVMFQMEPHCIEPKLTEITFCPSNNAICDAYERDDELYRTYNNDIFNCLFCGQVSDRIKKLS